MFLRECFSERLKSLRIKHKMTQKEFAEKVGITPATLSAYENQTNTPPLSVLVDIAEYANVSIDWLCGVSYIVNPMDCSNLGDIVAVLTGISKKVDTVIDENNTSYTHKALAAIGIASNYTFYFENDYLNTFIKEWSKIKKLYDEKTIDENLYNMWITNKISELSKYEL